MDNGKLAAAEETLSLNRDCGRSESYTALADIEEQKQQDDKITSRFSDRIKFSAMKASHPPPINRTPLQHKQYHTYDGCGAVNIVGLRYQCTIFVKAVSCRSKHKGAC